MEIINDMKINEALDVLRKHCDKQKQCNECPFLNPDWIKSHDGCVLQVNSPNHWQDVKEEALRADGR